MERTFWSRTDSNSANNPALNLTGAAPTRITFVRSGSNGDLILDHNGGAVDPDTQVMINGTAYDFTYELGALLPTRKSDGANQVPDQFEGQPIYVVTVQGYPGAANTTRLAFLPESGATQAEMASFGKGAISLQAISTTTPGAVCFALGTHILTPTGEVRVEDLRAGDLVSTLDDGAQPILWISTSRHRWPGEDPGKLPVLVSEDAFGPGLPHRDLVVSPQHAIVLSARSGAHGGDILAPSRGLTGLPGIRQMAGRREVTYFHVLLQSHSILISEGLATESFYPGATALDMLTAAQRAEVLSLLPGLRAGFGPHARPRLTVRQVENLQRRDVRVPVPAHFLSKPQVAWAA